MTATKTPGFHYPPDVKTADEKRRWIKCCWRVLAERDPPHPGAKQKYAQMELEDQARAGLAAERKNHNAASRLEADNQRLAKRVAELDSIASMQEADVEAERKTVAALQKQLTTLQQTKAVQATDTVGIATATALTAMAKSLQRDQGSDQLTGLAAVVAQAVTEALRPLLEELVRPRRRVVERDENGSVCAISEE